MLENFSFRDKQPIKKEPGCKDTIRKKEKEIRHYGKLKFSLKEMLPLMDGPRDCHIE